MAGTGASYGLDKGFLVNSSYGAVTRFRCVKLNADGTISATTLGSDIAIGVVQEDIDAAKVSAGKAVADVRVAGITKVVASAALAVGTRVQPAAGGKVAAATGTNFAIGIIVGGTAAADNDVCEILLTPGSVAS